MAVDKQILDFVESFWPLNYSEEELSRSYDEKMHALRGHFPSDVLDSLDSLVKIREEKISKGGNGIEEYQRITNIVFANRMHSVWYPQAVFSSRIALSLLLQHLRDVPAPFRLLDMGCGSGMVDIGLVLQIPNIQRVYAVDKSSEALDVFRENIDLKAPAYRDKFVLLNRDYTVPDFFDEFKGLEPDGVPVSLAVFPFRGAEDLLSLFPVFLNNSGSVLSCFTVNRHDTSFSWDEIMDCVDGDYPYSYTARWGVRFEGLNYSPVDYDSAIKLAKISHL